MFLPLNSCAAFCLCLFFSLFAIRHSCNLTCWEMSSHIWSFQGEYRERNLERRCSTGTLIWQAGKNMPLSTSAPPHCAWWKSEKPPSQLGSGDTARPGFLMTDKGPHPPVLFPYRIRSQPQAPVCLWFSEAFLRHARPHDANLIPHLTWNKNMGAFKMHSSFSGLWKQQREWKAWDKVSGGRLPSVWILTLTLLNEQAWVYVWTPLKPVFPWALLGRIIVRTGDIKAFSLFYHIHIEVCVCRTHLCKYQNLV